MAACLIPWWQEDTTSSLQVRTFCWLFLESKWPGFSSCFLWSMWAGLMSHYSMPVVLWQCEGLVTHYVRWCVHFISFCELFEETSWRHSFQRAVQKNGEAYLLNNHKHNDRVRFGSDSNSDITPNIISFRLHGQALAALLIAGPNVSDLQCFYCLSFPNTSTSYDWLVLTFHAT